MAERNVHANKRCIWGFTRRGMVELRYNKDPLNKVPPIFGKNHIARQR